MCELCHHPCDDFVTHKMCTLQAKWMRQPARLAFRVSTETIYAVEAGSGRAPPLSRTYELWYRGRNFFPINAPGMAMGRFELLNLGGFGLWVRILRKLRPF